MVAEVPGMRSTDGLGRETITTKRFSSTYPRAHQGGRYGFSCFKQRLGREMQSLCDVPEGADVMEALWSARARTCSCYGRPRWC